jgi:hypothetical protein
LAEAGSGPQQNGVLSNVRAPATFLPKPLPSDALLSETPPPKTLLQRFDLGWAAERPFGLLAGLLGGGHARAQWPKHGDQDQYRDPFGSDGTRTRDR